MNNKKNYIVVDLNNKEPIEFVVAENELEAAKEISGCSHVEPITKGDLPVENLVMCFEFNNESDDAFDDFIEDDEFIIATSLYEKTHFYKTIKM